MSSLQTLKDLVRTFENAQKAFADQGALDTEPCTKFQVLLVKAFRGKNPIVPDDAEGWELYEDEPGAGAAAQVLCKTAWECVACIQSAKIGEAAELEAYLRGYCDRVVIAWRK